MDREILLNSVEFRYYALNQHLFNVILQILDFRVEIVWSDADSYNPPHVELRVKI